jgi:hypothetical protein
MKKPKLLLHLLFVDWEVYDLRDEIAEYERKYRPFPPRSGSVSKPRNEPKPDSEYLGIHVGMRAA